MIFGNSDTKRPARATFCVHYRAMSEHKTCLKDVSYSTFDGMPFDQRPCFRKDRTEAPRCGCDLVQFATDAELDRAEEFFNKRMKKMSDARAAIVIACGGPWKRGMPSCGGLIKCPACDNDDALSYSRSSYNGHIHACCKTDGCVKWME